tara:strand:+ start:374 stop:688 length:315 start_codon:yes stop_codon:yes gene_type:complete
MKFARLIELADDNQVVLYIDFDEGDEYEYKVKWTTMLSKNGGVIQMIFHYNTFDDAYDAMMNKITVESSESIRKKIIAEFFTNPDENDMPDLSTESGKTISEVG